MKRLSAIAGVLMGLSFGFTALSGSAYAASTHETPAGYVGAWNMLQDPTMLPTTGGAMDHANGNGDLGMCGAVLESSGVGC